MENRAVESLKEFETKICAINVKDFGDFRRKSNSYLNRLKEQLAPEQLGPVYLELKTLINDRPNWQMEPTRRAILEKVQKLKSKFAAGGR